MNHQKLSIRYVISKAKTNKIGLCPISCRLTYRHKRKSFATGLFVNPNHWNPKMQLVTSKSSEYQNINTQLTIVSNKISNTYLSLLLEDLEFSVDDIFNNFNGKPINEKVFVVSYFRGYVAKIKKLVGKDMKLSTWKKYNYTCIQVASFVRWKYKKEDIPLEYLNLQFLTDLEYYFKTELNHVQITINKAIQRFRKPIRISVAEGYLDKDPFVLHKPGRVRKEVIFLSTDELSILEEHHFTQPRLELVKDLFIFCCYTGLAYHEMSHLKKENIVKGFDGNQWIQMKREKTGKMISVPLLPKAKAILEKYDEVVDYALPRFSNQKINSYLKEIAGIVGINKSISHHMARKTFASTVLLYNDVPMEIVSELLGHSSLKITQEYYGKVVQKRVSEEMRRVSNRLI